MSQLSFPILSLITFTPLLGAVLILLMPKGSDRAIKLLCPSASLPCIRQE